LSSPAPENSHASHRDRSIRLAVLTSLVSKLGTIALRLISIPIAIRLLGMDQFGVYAAITMVVSVIDMMHIGLGPALTRELSKAVAKNDRKREQAIFVTCVVVSTALTLLAAFAAAWVLFHVPIPTIFGEKFEGLSEVMHRAAWLGLAIITIEMVCITFEMGRDGYMETRYTNAWGAAGNVFGALFLVAGIWFFPTIEFLLIAVNGSIALAKLGNTIHLLVQRPYLLPRFSLFDRTAVLPLLKDGIRFSVTYIMAAAVEYNLMVFLIGRHAGPEAVGVFQVMITVHFSMAGIIAMFTKPYWPALMDAFERRDRGWILKSSNRLLLGGIGFSLATGAGLVALGPLVLPLWVGESFLQVKEGFVVDRLALLAFSFYFVAHISRHINQTLVLGLGRLNSVVAVVVLEGTVVLALAGLVLVRTLDIALVYFAMTAAISACSGWLFPVLFRCGLRDQADLEGLAKNLGSP